MADDLGFEMERACMTGSLDALKSIFQFARNRCATRNNFQSKFPQELMKRISNAMQHAIRFHHLDCVQYLYHNSDRKFFYALQDAAGSGDVNILKWLHLVGERIDCQSTYCACKHGHIECLKYAREQGAEWHYYAASMAATGHLECLVYAHENGAPWNMSTCAQAASTGSMDCLKYAVENGAELNTAASFYAAKGDHTECLVYLVCHGCPFSLSSTHMNRNIMSVIDGLNKRRSAKKIQRSWRRYRFDLKRHSVQVIENAYIKWSCRPVFGAWYERALESYNSHNS